MRGATSQGVSRPQEELDQLPFEPVGGAEDGAENAQFGGLALETVADNNTGYLLARPQRPFRGERLVISVFDTTEVDPLSPAAAAQNVVIDPAMFVGAVQIGAAQGSTPVSAFGATAFGVRLSLPAAGQGTDIKIFLRALLAADPDDGRLLVVNAVLFGRAVR
jgi:hypothetical protein